MSDLNDLPAGWQGNEKELMFLYEEIATFKSDCGKEWRVKQQIGGGFLEIVPKGDGRRGPTFSIGLADLVSQIAPQIEAADAADEEEALS